MTAYLRGSRLENPSLLPEEGQAEGEERLSQLENPAEQALAKGRGRPAPRDVSWGAPGLPSRQAAELPRPGLTPSRWQPSVTLQGRSRRPVVKLFCTTAPGHCRSLSHTRTSTRAHTHTLPFHAKEGHRPARFVTHRQEPAGRRRWARRDQVQSSGWPLIFTTFSSDPPSRRPRGLVRPRASACVPSISASAADGFPVLAGCLGGS